MAVFKVRARIQFPDGTLSGIIRVKAATQDEAGHAAIRKLNDIWNATTKHEIMITSIAAAK